jgi:hypothetical protein
MAKNGRGSEETSYCAKTLNKDASEASLLNPSIRLVAALGMTKLIAKFSTNFENSLLCCSSPA